MAQGKSSRSGSAKTSSDSRGGAGDEPLTHRSPASPPAGLLGLYGIKLSHPVQAKRPLIPYGLLEYHGVVERKAAEPNAAANRQEDTAAQQRDDSAGAAETAVQAKTGGQDAGQDARAVHDAAQQGTQGAGGSLPYLDQIQASFGGHDLSQIQAHTDAQAQAGSRAMGAEAFTTGNHVAFAGTPSLHTAAHEAAHVIQQRAGVQLAGGVGQVGDAYERHADQVADQVVAGKSSEALLATFTGADAASSGYLQHKAVQRYDSYEHATIGDAAKGGQKQKIQGIDVTPGEINALADFYATPTDLMQAKPDELKQLVTLIRKQQKDPKSVSEADWDKATAGRYNDLNLKNSKHFGPQNKELITPPGGSHGADNRSTWEGYHRTAITKAQAAALENDQAKRQAFLAEAKITNAFADHYLTDAFSAGHLFNKDDSLAVIQKNLASLKKNELEKVFLGVAKQVWTKQSSLIKKYEVYKKTGIPFQDDWWALDSVDRFKSLMEGIYAERPDVVQSAIIKAAHDTLDTRQEGNAVGVAVVSDRDPKGWVMSGDRTLDKSPTTQEWIKKAIEQGRANITAASNPVSVDPDALVRQVRAYFPRPTGDSAKMIAELLKKMTDPKGGLVDAVAGVVEKEIQSLFDVLVEKKKVRLIK